MLLFFLLCINKFGLQAQFFEIPPSSEKRALELKVPFFQGGVRGSDHWRC